EKNLESCATANHSITEFTTQLKIVQSDIEKVNAGEGTCEYCKQNIPDEHKKGSLKTLQSKAKNFEKSILKLTEQIKKDVQDFISETGGLIDIRKKEIETDIKKIDDDIELCKTKHMKMINEKLQIELAEIEKRLEESTAIHQIKTKEMEEILKTEKE